MQSKPHPPVYPAKLGAVRVVGQVHKFVGVEVNPAWQLLSLLEVHVGGGEHKHARLGVASMGVGAAGSGLVAVCVVVVHWKTCPVVITIVVIVLV